eukprot:gnl/Chilomastix_caulleri/3873.p1 GENE.gnl/Chilomastix_caulleri/3873~~gnl/Chilomastix_caulleri/3873.p1  ORF type:complete len:107 (+),score=13.48 gnl/Chilomastix_caulleri/3873:29-322(+)
MVTATASSPTTRIVPSGLNSINRSSLQQQETIPEMSEQDRALIALLTNNLLVSNLLISMANDIPENEMQNDRLVLTLLEASSKGDRKSFESFFGSID